MRFKKAVEDLTGVRIDGGRLREAIETVNAKRRALHRLSRLRAADPAPISGLDALLINQVYFYDNPTRFTESVNRICDELERRIANRQGVVPAGTPRIVISGCPMAVPNWKVPWIVETSGAVVVGEESCVGERGTRNLVDPSGTTVDELVDAIVERYFQINCAIFTPNPARLAHVEEMVREYKANGVIHYGLQFCQPYLMEAIPMTAKLKGMGIAALAVETDYAEQDAGQLRTRLQAFVEMLR